MRPTARIVIVGNEVLTAEVADSNSPFLLATLARLGTRTTELRVVPDEKPDVVEAVRHAASAADRVLVAGGIGPTHDDCTRPAVAEALHLPLVRHPEALGRLRAAIHRPLTPEDEAMADLPQGAELLLAEDVGGFGFRVGRVFVFPGVPRLLQRLVAANQRLLAGTPWVRREVHTDLAEGVIALPLARLARAWPQVRWGSYPRMEGDGCRLVLVLRTDDEATADAAEAALREMLADLEKPERG